MTLTLRLVLLPFLLLTATVAVESAPSGVNWPSFRGPAAAGVQEGAPTPVKWDVPQGQNVRWKTPIPGLGHSSPIVWGDRIWVTTAISSKDDPELKVGLYGDIGSVDDTTVHQ